jgi:hypothetical protein
MYPTGFAHGGVIQGNPVPVGSGRHSRRSGIEMSRRDYGYVDSDSTGSRSGGSSPDSADARLVNAISRTSTSRQYSRDIRDDPRSLSHYSTRRY